MKHHKLFAFSLASVLIVLIAGCAPVIQPRVSSSEFLIAGNKVPGRVELFVLEEFTSYKAEKTDVSELKTWKFELGPVAVDSFRFALESRFEQVSVTLGTPRFPVDAGAVFYAAVQPSFVSFKASDPILFRFEDYKATIGFNMSVFDADGKIILSQTYTGEGTQQGSIGYADPGHAAYPIAVQNAVKDATKKFVNDLVGISNRGRQ
jgi:hypothetical protein